MPIPSFPFQKAYRNIELMRVPIESERKEASAVSGTNDRQDHIEPQTDDARVEELTTRLRAALEGLERGRALYIAISSLVGEDPDRELPIMNPDTGRVIAYLLPPWDRHSLHAAARHPSRDVLGDPPVTLDELLQRFSRCMDPVPTNANE
jgi:hypothetical protein